MYCPMLKCDWEVSDLVSSNSDEPVRPEDELVTQFSALVDHLKSDHDAVIGGRD